jgi:hypothetical protein
MTGNMEYIYNMEGVIDNWICDSSREKQGLFSLSYINKSKKPRYWAPLGRATARHRLFWSNWASSTGFFQRVFRETFPDAQGDIEKLIAGVLSADAGYFTQKLDAVGVRGASTDQKLTAALRQLSLGVGADAVVEYVRLSESAISECLKRFCAGVVSEFKREYPRNPNTDELRGIENN